MVSAISKTKKDLIDVAQQLFAKKVLRTQR